MKKLINQIIKFGVVGIIAFIIDFFITMVVFNILNGHLSLSVSSTVASVFGFIISVIVNYLLSMKYVFARKTDINKSKEFIIFIVLSVIGLGINSLIIWLSTAILYSKVEFIYNNVGDSLFVACAKIFATFIVMVYNFITRKIFLEK